MTYASDISTDRAARDVATHRFEGVRTARVIGFCVDWLLIGLISVGLSILTLGVGFLFFGFIFPAVALIYLAATMGGARQATPGMRLMGVRIHRVGGGLVDPIVAALHGVLFWFLGWWSLPTTFFSSRKRLLHDIALGTFVAKA